MTVGECAKHILGDQTFDTALPQRWLDEAVAKTGIEYREIYCSFVWAYDGESSVFGRPCALTHRGNEILTAINAAFGSSFPLTEQPPV